MEQDRYLKEFSRAIFNWYLESDTDSLEPIFNTLVNGMANGMEIFAPIEIKEGQQLKKASDDVYVLEDGNKVDFLHIANPGDGGLAIPLFTSVSEMRKGERVALVSVPLAALLDSFERWEGCTGFIVNPWGRNLFLSGEIISMLSEYVPISRVQILKSSVLNAHVGAIVNAANESLLGGGGVDGAIHRAAGKSLLEECKGLGGCKTGEAKITGAYNIKYADHIIHTVGPVYSGKDTDAELLASCYIKSLDLALANNCKSIAFPGISTGVYGYPMNEAAAVSIEAITAWLNAHPDVVMNIYLCCFKDAEFEAYIKVLES